MNPQQIQYLYRPATPPTTPARLYRPGGRYRRWSTRPYRDARAA